MRWESFLPPLIFYKKVCMVCCAVVMKPTAGAQIDEVILGAIDFAKKNNVSISLENLQPGIDPIEVYPQSMFMEIKDEFRILIDESKR
jgi:hypothetical protein